MYIPKREHSHERRPQSERAAPTSAKRLSSFYEISIIGGTILGALVLFIILAAAFSTHQNMTRQELLEFQNTLAVLTLVAVAIFLYADVVFLVLLYKAWASIQDGHARTTPGKAVGFLFIPLFNFYWVFEAFPGFAKDYNAYIARHQIPSPSLPEGPFTAFCVLAILSIVPCLGYIAALICIVFVCVLASRMSEAINSNLQHQAD